MRSPATLAVPATLLAMLAALWMPGMAAAQGDLDRPLRVFLDCTDFFCDESYFVGEIPWVDFVRDREDADVHVLGTRQSTGGGGGAYTLEFRGRSTLDGQRITLRRLTAADATESIVRSALAETVKLGLAPFAAGTSVAPLVEILAPEITDDTAAAPPADPWDRWTFRLSVNGFMSGESRQQFLDAYASATASRITEEWKTIIGFSGSQSESEFQINDSTTFITSQESYSADAGTVRSIGRHWGVGGSRHGSDRRSGITT